MANPRTIARLESRILERAAHCLQFEIRDPRATFVTITRVALSSDLSSGRIYWSVLGGAADKSKAEHMLGSAAGFIQRQVARVLDLRRMPHLKWVYDDSAEQAQRVEDLIKEARARDRTINPHVDDAPIAAAAAEPDEDEDEVDDELGDGPDDDADLEDGEAEPLR